MPSLGVQISMACIHAGLSCVRARCYRRLQFNRLSLLLNNAETSAAYALRGSCSSEHIPTRVSACLLENFVLRTARNFSDFTRIVTYDTHRVCLSGKSRGESLYLFARLSTRVCSSVDARFPILLVRFAYPSRPAATRTFVYEVSNNLGTRASPVTGTPPCATGYRIYSAGSTALIILFRGSRGRRDARALADAFLILTSNVEFRSQLRSSANNLARFTCQFTRRCLLSPPPAPRLPFARRILCSATIASKVCAHMQRSSIFMLISMLLLLIVVVVVRAVDFVLRLIMPFNRCIMARLCNSLVISVRRREKKETQDPEGWINPSSFSTLIAPASVDYT